MVVYLDQKVQSIVSYCFGIRNLADIPHRINQCIGKKRLVIGRNLMNKSLLRTANMCDLVTCAIQIVCVWTRPGYKTRSIRHGARSASQIPVIWVKKWIVDLKQINCWLLLGIVYWSHCKKINAKYWFFS